MTDQANEAPRTTAALMQRIDSTWRALASALAGVSDEVLGRPGPDGGWSIKDHLAHIMVWERRLLAHLQNRPPHELMGVPDGLYEQSGIDAVNAEIERQHRGRPAADVRRDLDATHAQVVAALQARPDQEAEGVVIGNTYTHYPEHAEAIRRLAGRP